MADVRDRAQLIVITGLVLAAILVALALVVNSAIYTENVATRDTDRETGQVQAEHHLAEEDLQRLIDRSNRETSTDDWSSVSATFLDSYGHWDGTQRTRFGTTGRSMSTALESTTQGTHIRQTDNTRNFAAGDQRSGEADWTLADGVTEAGPFYLTVERESLLDVEEFDSLTDPLASVSGNAFHVSIQNNTGEWRVYVFRDSAMNVYLYTVGPNDDSLSDQFDSVDVDGGLLDADETCQASTTGDYVTLDFREPRFGDQTVDCEAIEFYNDRTLGTDHSISYRNAESDAISFPNLLDDISGGDRVRGTYELVVDVEADRSPYHEPDSGDDPHAAAVIHSATLSIEYRSSELHFRSSTVSTSWSVVP